MNERSILVVDDDESLRRVTQVQLEDEGYSVATARNAEDALRLPGRKHQDLVITNLSMTVLTRNELRHQLFSNAEVIREKPLPYGPIFFGLRLRRSHTHPSEGIVVEQQVIIPEVRPAACFSE